MQNQHNEQKKSRNQNPAPQVPRARSRSSPRIRPVIPTVIDPFFVGRNIRPTIFYFFHFSS